MYIYKLGTECDGAQMRASVVYIPTLVALLGLCFDPSECFWDLRVWSGVVGNKSGKLRYMLQIMTASGRTCSSCRHHTLPHSWQHCRRPAPVSSTTLGGQSSQSHGGHGQCHGGAGGLLGHTAIPGP